MIISKLYCCLKHGFMQRMSFLVMVLLLSVSAGAQMVQSFPIELKWKGVAPCYHANDSSLYIVLESAQYEGNMPVYVHSMPIFDSRVKVDFDLVDVKTIPLSNEEMRLAEGFACDDEFEVEATPLASRDEARLSIRVVPFQKRDGRLEKLVSARLEVRFAPDSEKAYSNRSYVHSSAMAMGDWYKIGLNETGVYKLTYNDLKSLGLNLSNLDPRTLRIYHNGGGLLPEKNAEARHDDLVEIPIYVHGEADGRFDQSDYILFYGRGPVCWKYNTQQRVFDHQPNPYEDYSYAFVVTGLGNGKRLGEAESPSGSAAETVSEFLDYQVYEADDFNLNKTGRTRFGDKMDGNVSKTFPFVFPNIVKSQPCKLNVNLASRNFKMAYFEVYVDNVLGANYPIGVVSSTGYAYAIEVGGRISAVPQKDTVSVKLTHKAVVNTVSEGYVDFIAVNAWRKLSFQDGQMAFCNPEAVLINKVYEYRLSGATQQTQIWNVTNPVEPALMRTQWNASVLSFKVMGGQRSEFVALDGNKYLSAKTFGVVDNQNLHGIRDVDYLIVSHPYFLAQAERLKGIHAVINPDLNVYVTTPELIYNEFSCGAKDITAIRDFCRMLYHDSSAGRKIKYLLLMGDCSFDQKNRTDLVDFVPSFESVSSLDMQNTFVSDDYYGFMDENEGSLNGSIADIGIGRFPVATEEQASQMIDKIERYVASDASTMNPWRNVISFIADDEDGFVDHAESLVQQIQQHTEGAVLFDKFYLDAYEQVSSPGGEICPEMNAAINDRMEKGTLVLNYIGHGGETQLAVERILQKKDVDSWRNGPMYPLMITGTCEFSRYDDHTRTSLGEYAFLNPYGGMIAMFTTSRVTHGPHNFTFMSEIYNNMFRIEGGEHYRLGDLYRMAKTRGTDYEKRYVFFGDPALRLSYPKWTVETQNVPDTLKALQPAMIEGVVKDFSGQVAEGFNGVVYVTVFDKAAELTTLGMGVSPATEMKPFTLRNSIIFNGKTEVVNGRFQINFVVPRDIAYRYGSGLISYYATDYAIDANGSYEDFIIGGFYDDAVADDNPPEIRLFINDTLFVDGGITGESPVLLAFLNDENGINTTGAGIGHDIMATLNGPSKNAYCLNDYFVSELDNPGKGYITFKMHDLSDGDYTLTLKAWDIYNNSNSAIIHFTVVNSSEMNIEKPVNYPNPVADETSFVFEHNQGGNNIRIRIDIFDIMGRWVTTLAETVDGSSTRTTPIRWDGTGARGERLSNGIYIYRITATNDTGETASVVSKLVLSK